MELKSGDLCVAGSEHFSDYRPNWSAGKRMPNRRASFEALSKPNGCAFASM
jgi:hypothetical protein